MGKPLALIGMTAVFGLLLITLTLTLAGCDKERIVESTEYVHDIEYVQLPPDTIIQLDTIYSSDSVVVYRVDTVRTTVIVHDTVVTVRNYYDTVTIIDTVLQNNPNELLAVAAMQYHTDPLVIDFINQEFGYTDGWVLYLSPFQMDIAQRSTGVWDMAGYIDYWAPDWSGYYPIDFAWRVTFSGGDPSNPSNWQLSEPPAAVAGHLPGLVPVNKTEPTSQLLK